MNEEKIRRRNLPHWDMPGAAYFVTTCLEGSIPAQGVLELARNRKALLSEPRPADLSEDAWNTYRWKRHFGGLESYLDLQPANRILANPALARIVCDAINHFAGARYDLYAFVVMPSHFHWLFQPRKDWTQTLVNDARSPRERITYTLNRFTATECNKILKRKGRFWQGESYDHWVRDLDELERIIRYIEENPVKAGLVSEPQAWEFSSAFLRKKLALPWGEPIPGASCRH